MVLGAPALARLTEHLQAPDRGDEVGHGRVRPAHRALDRKVFAAGSDFWQRWYPPNGHGCRCGVDTLSPAQVEAQGLQVESELPRQIEVPGYGVVQMIPEPGQTFIFHRHRFQVLRRQRNQVTALRISARTSLGKHEPP